MTDTTATLPGAVPYVLRAGDGIAHLVAGQVVRTVARTDETAGGFGAVVCECPLDRGPIPMHWHEREHDTWFVTRGRLQVWANDQSRVLAAGDFAYVPPGDHHSYRSVSPRTSFFGVVAPGGWEQFFADAGEVWGMTALPPAERPFDFSRMGPAMGKHRIMRVDDAVYAEATPIGAADQTIPDQPASYFLEGGFGDRRVLAGLLATTVLPLAQSGGLVDMRTVEGGRGASLPTIRHASTHVFLYVLDGIVSATIGEEDHRLTSGDAANIPAGTPYRLRVESGAARWIATTSGGDGGGFWDAGTIPTHASHPIEQDQPDDWSAVLGGVDAARA